MSIFNAYIEGIHVTDPYKQGEDFARSKFFATTEAASDFARQMWTKSCAAEDDFTVQIFYSTAYVFCMNHYNFTRVVDTPVGSFNASWNGAEREVREWLEIESNKNKLKAKKDEVKLQVDFYNERCHLDWADMIYVDIKIKVLRELNHGAYLLFKYGE